MPGRIDRSIEGSGRIRFALFTVAAVLLASLAFNVILLRRGSSPTDRGTAPLDAGAPAAESAPGDRRPSLPAASSIADGARRPIDPGPARAGDSASGAIPGAAGLPATKPVATEPTRPAPLQTDPLPSPQPSEMPEGGLPGRATDAPTQPGTGGSVPPAPPATAIAPPRPQTPPAAPAGSGASNPAEKPAEKPAPEVDPTEDRTPPSLSLFRFDPPEVKDGGVATLTIQASDDLSGVVSVKGAVSSPGGTAVLPFEATGDGGGNFGVFVAQIAIPARAETGVWWVSNVYVLDRANNPLVANFGAATAPPGARLRVLSAESDSTPPEVRSLWVDKLTLSGGEKNGVRVEVRDDQSGVAAVRGAFQSPSKSAQVPFLCAAGADPAFWEGPVSIPANAECGRWTLQTLRVTDNAGNLALLTGLSPQMAGAEFVVAGGDCDSLPTSLERVDLSPVIVTNDAASGITITVGLSDEGHRAISISGWAAGPASTNGQVPRIFFSCARASNDPGAPWTGTISVPQYAAKGIWRIGLVRLQDKSLTFRDYTPASPVLAQAWFEVR